MSEPDYVVDAMKKLNDDDQSIVIKTVIWLGYAKDSRPSETLKSYLDHASADIRRWTIRTLAQIGDEDTLKSIQSCHNDADEMVSNTVDWAVKHFPAYSSITPDDCTFEDLELIVHTLGNGTSDQKILAIYAMAVLDWPHIELAFPHVLKALDDQNPDVRKNALKAFEPSMITDSKAYFFAVKGCLLDDDVSVRSEAASHMGGFLQGIQSQHHEDAEGIIKPMILQNDENIIKNVGWAFFESGGDLELIQEAITMLHEITITNIE